MWAICLREPGIAAADRLAVIARIEEVFRTSSDRPLLEGARTALAQTAITDEPELRQRIADVMVAQGMLSRAAADRIPTLAATRKRLPRVRGRLLDPRACRIPGEAAPGVLLVDCTQYVEPGCNDWKHRAEVVFHVGARGWKQSKLRVERHYTGEYCLRVE